MQGVCSAVWAVDRMGDVAGNGTGTVPATYGDDRNGTDCDSPRAGERER